MVIPHVKTPWYRDYAWAVEPLSERLVTNAAAGTVYSLPSMQCAGHGKQSEREAGSSISRNILYWLVAVLTILKNMLVNGTDDIPYLMDNSKNV